MGNKQKDVKNALNTSSLNTVVLGAGCFWCVEATLQRLKGVQKVESGYAGGHLKNPTYKDICKGTIGHTEVVRVVFDPKIVAFQTILYISMHLHDPTILKKQQYKSIIFYQKSNHQELEVIKTVLEEVKKDGQYPGFPSKLVTQIKELDNFYTAEERHQSYFDQNPNQSYCQTIIKPKIGKLQELFKQFVDEKII